MRTVTEMMWKILGEYPEITITKANNNGVAFTSTADLRTELKFEHQIDVVFDVTAKIRTGDGHKAEYSYLVEGFTECGSVLANFTDENERNLLAICKSLSLCIKLNKPDFIDWYKAELRAYLECLVDTGVIKDQYKTWVRLYFMGKVC